MINNNSRGYEYKQVVMSLNEQEQSNDTCMHQGSTTTNACIKVASGWTKVVNKQGSEGGLCVTDILPFRLSLSHQNNKQNQIWTIITIHKQLEFLTGMQSNLLSWSNNFFQV